MEISRVEMIEFINRLANTSAVTDLKMEEKVKEIIQYGEYFREAIPDEWISICFPEIQHGELIWGQFYNDINERLIEAVRFERLEHINSLMGCQEDIMAIHYKFLKAVLKYLYKYECANNHSRMVTKIRNMRCFAEEFPLAEEFFNSETTIGFLTSAIQGGDLNIIYDILLFNHFQFIGKYSAKTIFKLSEHQQLLHSAISMFEGVSQDMYEQLCIEYLN
jgi:hypothetical protein